MNRARAFSLWAAERCAASAWMIVSARMSELCGQTAYMPLSSYHMTVSPMLRTCTVSQPANALLDLVLREHTVLGKHGVLVDALHPPLSSNS